MITLTIDDQEIQVRESQTILEAAREHHIHIPTLCYHEAMKPFGACRLCVVEVEMGRGQRRLGRTALPGHAQADTERRLRYRRPE